MNVIEILDRPIAFHRCLVAVTDSVGAALMLSQAVYWSNRTSDPDGWFYKTAEEWEEETGLTRRAQEGARSKLRKTQFWEEKLRGVPATLFYRLNAKKLAAALTESFQADDGKPVVQFSQNVKSSFTQKGKQDSTKSRNKIPQKGKTIIGTETTTEITTEKGATSPPSLKVKEINQADPTSDETLKAELSKICGVAPTKQAWKIKNAAEAISAIGGTVDLLREYVRAEGVRVFKIEFIASDFGGWLAARRRSGASDQTTTAQSRPHVVMAPPGWRASGRRGAEEVEAQGGAAK